MIGKSIFWANGAVGFLKGYKSQLPNDSNRTIKTPPVINLALFSMLIYMF